MTRYRRKRENRTARKIASVLFFFIVPLMAITTSMFFMDMYNNGDVIEASKGGLTSDSVAAFKYNFEMGNKTLYRIELKSSESLPEAEAYIKSLKTKKLNGLILKEEGYKVIYGTFTDIDEASKVRDSIAKKAGGSILETKLSSYSLKYDEADSTFAQLVQATDKLIWEIAESKSLLSKGVALAPKSDVEPISEKIINSEVKLEKYLGYAEKIKVSKEQGTFRDNFVILLEEVLAHRLDSEKDYYKIQVNLMNQIEAYRRFIEKLSN